MAVATVLGAAQAGPVAPPCPGCVFFPSEQPGPSPLIVLLHGDNELAKHRASEWRGAARERGFAVLALACPESLGCHGSYWQWDGNPAWVDQQIDRLSQQVAIDPRRIWLVGWSGGASYMGMRAGHFGRRYAALVFHGGGTVPREPCPPSGATAQPPSPVLFLVGNRNPLHGLVLDLRKELEHCGHEITWWLLPGADHAGERAVLGDRKQMGRLLDWLAAHGRPDPGSEQKKEPEVRREGVGKKEAPPDLGR